MTQADARTDEPQRSIPIDARLSLIAATVTVVETDPATAADPKARIVEIQPSDPDNPDDVLMAQHTTVERNPVRLSVSNTHTRKNRAFKPRGAPRGSVRVTVWLPAGSDLEAKLATGDVRCSVALSECQVEIAAGTVELERTQWLKLQTGVGDVTVAEVGEDARIEHANGDIGVGRIGGEARIDNASGDIRVGSIAGKAKLSGANGDIVVQRCGDSATAGTAVGSIRLQSVSRGRVKADSARGDIEVGIADGIAAWLDLNTAFGHAHSELDRADAPADRDRTVEVHAHTAFGDVTIHRAPAADDAELAASEA